MPLGEVSSTNIPRPSHDDNSVRGRVVCFVSADCAVWLAVRPSASQWHSIRLLGWDVQADWQVFSPRKWVATCRMIIHTAVGISSHGACQGRPARRTRMLRGCLPSWRPGVLPLGRVAREASAHWQLVQSVEMGCDVWNGATAHSRSHETSLQPCQARFDPREPSRLLRV